VRAVLDPIVIIAALISSTGSPARLVDAWRSGRFELIVSDLLLAELERALAYPKLRRRVPAEDAAAALEWLRRDATLLPGPSGDPPVRSTDSGDDYLIALAATSKALLVSGDDHLLRLAETLAIVSPAAFLARLEEPSIG
jgi:putative PIN family toxin of toxin-antitoxin system